VDCVQKTRNLCGYLETDTLEKVTSETKKEKEGNIEMSRRKIENQSEKWMNWIGIFYKHGFNC
jgi:hypothetical protein